MASKDDHAQAVAGALQALFANAPAMSTQSINSLTQQILSAPPPIAAMPVTSNAELANYDGQPGGLARRNTRLIQARVRRTRTRNNRAREGSPKVKGSKGLNGFIAFRTYHHATFRGLVQKNISPLLNQMWQVDPQQALWKLQGAVWSKIKSTHGRIPLANYFHETNHMLGIVQAEDYLDTMGWQVVCNDVGDFVLRETQLNRRNQAVNHSAVSIDDLIEHCDAVGLMELAEKVDGATHPVGGTLMFATNPIGNTHANHTAPATHANHITIAAPGIDNSPQVCPLLTHQVSHDQTSPHHTTANVLASISPQVPCSRANLLQTNNVQAADNNLNSNITNDASPNNFMDTWDVSDDWSSFMQNEMEKVNGIF